MKTVKVKAVRKVETPQYVYDITVQDNHNLYAMNKNSESPILVHNCLDENRTHLAGSPFNTPHGGLEQIFMVYGNDHYKTATFGKGDRANPNLTRLDNKDFIEYGCVDPEALVRTDKGELSLRSVVELVTAGGTISVDTFNHATGQLEQKLVTKGEVKSTSLECFELEYDGGALKLTSDHKVWSVTRNGYVEVQDMFEGEEILVDKP